MPVGLVTTTTTPPRFHSLSFTPQYPSTPPPTESEFFPHLLPLLYRLIKTLLDPAAASSPRFRSSGDTIRDHLCIRVRHSPPSCVRLWGLDTAECLDMFFYLHILVGDTFVLLAPAMQLSSFCFFGACYLTIVDC